MALFDVNVESSSNQPTHKKLEPETQLDSEALDKAFLDDVKDDPGKSAVVEVEEKK